METTIRNDRLTVVCDSMGGEQRAITSEEGIEYLWNGDPRFWKGRAPNAVPLCGAAEKQPGPVGCRGNRPAPPWTGPYPGNGRWNPLTGIR